MTNPLQARRARERASEDRATIKSLEDALHEALARNKFADKLAAIRPDPVIHRRETASGVREMTVVVLASDWHVEEPVDPLSVAGRNRYNLRIAAARVAKFFDSIVWTVEHHRASGKVSIRDLVLWLGGDLMSGYIHPELAEVNALSPTETVRWLVPKLYQGILFLLETLGLESMVIPCSFGNHGRTTVKSRVSTGYSNSFEWLMYHHLADLLKGDARVTFEITPSAHQYVRVYNTTLHFHHGDEVRYQGGVGGLGIPLLKAVPSWDEVRHADVHNIGHWHSLRDFGRAVVNGSLIGFGSYSQKIRASFERPQQALYFVDSRRGKCMLSSLWVD